MKIVRLFGGIYITEEQDKKLGDWVEEQRKISTATGCSGGRLTYCITPTTIGVVLKVQDNLTENEIDLTDYESW